MRLEKERVADNKRRLENTTPKWTRLIRSTSKGESLTGARVNGMIQVMKLTEQQERQRRELFEQSYKASNPFRESSRGFREHGGPVSAGSTYRERARPRGLDASGRMSEIRVPAWGDWKAPSNGEVIPATSGAR